MAARLPNPALIPLAFYGLWAAIKNMKAAWRSREDRSTLARVQRLRVSALLTALAGIVPIVLIMVLHGPEWAFYTALVAVGVAVLLHLVLSFVYGLLS